MFVKNPLNKRIPRMLAGNAGKFLAVLLFLVLSISLASGFLVAEYSLRSGYDSTFEEYNIEDGHFELLKEMSDPLAEVLKNEKLSIFTLFNKDLEIKENRILRIYPVREEINRIALLEGVMPETDEEIVLERLFAGNNGYEIGSKVKLGAKAFWVSGIVAFSDYSSLFKNNADGLFDNTHFGIAGVNQEAFDELEYNDLHYTYAWKNHDPDLSPEEKNDYADEILDLVKEHDLIKDFVRRSDNQAIHFAGEDFGKDRVFMMVFFYITIVIIAFLYVVVMRSTIELEAKSVGSLRALGYTNGELIRHYSLLPLLVTLMGALIGNVLGYTLMKDAFIYIYTKSYSLIPAPVLWNAEAFVLTTLVPVLIILLIIYGFLPALLSLPIQKFLRNDLSRRKQKHAISLGKLSFIARFRLRIIFQNTSAYLVLLIGILLGSLLMSTGLMLPPLLENHQQEVLNNQICAYQYILRMPVETTDEQAEKFAVQSLELGEITVQVLGIEEDSQFLPEVSQGLQTREAIFSNGLTSKYGMEEGDQLELSKKYTDETYSFELGDTVYYPAGFTIFVYLDDFQTIFNCDETYFTGYFSNHKLNDLDEIFIASIRTERDLTLALDQLMDSMGQVFKVMAVFSVILFFVLIYVLSKQVVERNQQSIAMLKILGYENNEINNLYHVTTGLMVVFSFLISIPVCRLLLRIIFKQIMTKYIGWFDFYVAPWVYPVTIVSGLVSYLIIYVMQSRKTKGLSTAEFFKEME
ncbi:MAG TPA: ABC transporter permease [Clostridiaceae bacterium]|nr:ABC transporter permease [Clostridiaceae bacterium]